MAVTNETIIQKMMQELNKAKAVSHQKEHMTKHIEHVKLLCELLLEEKEDRVNKTMPMTTKTRITAAEMKAMMGSTENERTTSTSNDNSIDHDGANGDSIFDF